MFLDLASCRTRLQFHGMDLFFFYLRDPRCTVSLMGGSRRRMDAQLGTSRLETRAGRTGREDHTGSSREQKICVGRYLVNIV